MCVLLELRKNISLLPLRENSSLSKWMSLPAWCFVVVVVVVLGHAHIYKHLLWKYTIAQSNGNDRLTECWSSPLAKGLDMSSAH